MLGQLKKVWINVSPVSLCNKDIEDKAREEKKPQSLNMNV
jgi:hypothetical protein